MSINLVEDSELPENEVFNLIAFRSPADGTGQVVFPGGEAGGHKKCILVKAVGTPLAYSTAADIVAIEHGDGGDVATATLATSVGTPTTFTVAPAAGYTKIFAADEDICYNLTTDGNAANADIIVVTLRTIH